VEGSWLAVGGRKGTWSGWPLRRSARAAIEATFVLVLGVGVVWFTRKVVGVQDGAVLVFLVIVPALVYLVLRGDLAELRGPGGWAATFVQVARAEVSLTGDALIRIQDVDVRELKSAALAGKTDEPVLMDMPLGQRYAAEEVSEKLEFLSRSPRFRLVALVNQQGVFQGCISPGELKGLMQDEALSGGFLDAVAAANTRAVFRYPGTLQKVMVKDESSAEALSLMTIHNLDAVAVVDDTHQVLGIVEREQLVSRLILSLVPR
jgi:hypothetical protein